MEGQAEKHLPGQVGPHLFVAARARAYGEVVDGERLEAERLLLIVAGGGRVAEARLQGAYLGCWRRA